MEKFEINTTYPYEYIVKYAEKENCELIEHGNDNLIGHHLIVMELEKGKEVSFVYSAWNATYGGFYKCVLKN